MTPMMTASVLVGQVASSQGVQNDRVCVCVCMEQLREAPLGPGDAVGGCICVSLLSCVSPTIYPLVSNHQVTGVYRRAECVCFC